MRYPPEEVVRRFKVWADLPIGPDSNDFQFRARMIAWNEYVDARDGLAEGTTQRSQVVIPMPKFGQQMDMFVRKPEDADA